MIEGISNLPGEPDLIAGFIIRAAFAITIVILCAAVAGFMLKQASAAVRHRVWAMGMIVALLTPAMLFIAPQRRMGLIGVSGDRAHGRLSVNANLKTSALRDHDENFANDGQGFSPSTIGSDSNEQGNHGLMPITRTIFPRSSSLPSRFAPLHLLTWPVSLLIAWSVPTVFLLLRLIWGVIVARTMVRRAMPMDLAADADDATMVARLRKRFPQFTPGSMPRILESPAVQSPLCVGCFGSTILLPIGHRNWTVDQREAVLVHELAHIVRRDVAWQAIARLGCSIYWPHPLVWVAARQMRIERELACDDWVVGGGQSATCYARWLLELACELRSAKRMERLGVAMSAPSSLEKRVRAALDPMRKRNPVTRSFAALATILGTIVLLVAVTFSPLKAVDAPAKDPSTQPTPATQASDRDPNQIEHVAGQVVDEAGNGVAGARVMIVVFRVMRTAVTDAGGHFNIKIEPGRRPLLTIRAESKDSLNQGITRLPVIRPYTRVEAENIRITLKPAREYPITVADAANQAVAGAMVIAHIGVYDSVQVMTNNEGKAMLRVPVDAIPTFIVAEKKGTGLDYVLFSRRRDPQGEKFRLATNFAGPIHFLLSAMRTISVKVVDRDARPLADVSVSPKLVTKADKGGYLLMLEIPNEAVKTDGAGIARVSVPADVSEPVLFYTSIHGYYTQSGCEWDPKAENAKVEAVMAPAGRIHVSVVDVDGKPAANATVLFVDDRGESQYGIFRHIATDKDGICDAEAIPDSYYMFVASKGRNISAPIMQVIRATAVPNSIPIKLLPGVRVHGQRMVEEPAVPQKGVVSIEFDDDDSILRIHADATPGVVSIEFDDDDSYKKLDPDKRLAAELIGPRDIHPRVMLSQITDGLGNFEIFLPQGKYNFVDNRTPQPWLRRKFVVPADVIDARIDCNLGLLRAAP